MDADFNEDDSLLTGLITSERQRLENHLNVAIVPRNGLVYKSLSSNCNSRAVRLPFNQQITSIVSVKDLDGNDVTNVITPGFDKAYINGSAIITYNVTGYAPEAIKTAIKRLVGTAYKFREDLQNEQVDKLQVNAFASVDSYSNNPLL